MDTIILKIFFGSFVTFILLQTIISLLKPTWASKSRVLVFLGCLGWIIFITWHHGTKVPALASALLALGFFAHTFFARALERSVCVRLITMLDSPYGKTLDEMANVQ